MIRDGLRVVRQVAFSSAPQAQRLDLLAILT